MSRPSKNLPIVTHSMVECAGATSLAALINVRRANAHALMSTVNILDGKEAVFGQIS